MRHFLFGYGSLISKKSCQNTALTKNLFPVILHKFERGWYFHDVNFHGTALGISKKEESFCNGVCIEINEKDLPFFDKRERGYKRIQLLKKNIQSESIKESDTIWTYVIKKKRKSE